MADPHTNTGPDATTEDQNPEWKVKEENVREDAKTTARRARSLASQATAAKIDDHKNDLKVTLENIAAGLDKGREELDRNDLTRLTESASEQIRRLAGEIDHRDGQTIMASIADAARKRPVTSIIGGFAAGIALSRALKATPQTTGADDDVSPTHSSDFTAYNAE